MTPTKVIRRLIDIAAAEGLDIRQAVGVPDGVGACVLMTAIGCDVLKAFGVRAEPLPVGCVVMNAAYVAWHEAGSPGGREGKPAEAFCVADVGTTMQGSPDRPHRGLRGHLAIHVPTHHLLVDLTLGQFNRPDRAIAVPAAAGLEWPEGATFQTWPCGSGVRIQFIAKPDDRRYLESSWWTGGERGRFTPLIVRAIRKGGPLNLRGDLVRPSSAVNRPRGGDGT